jgi:predicted transglutaminase-like cysteine proteinase
MISSTAASPFDDDMSVWGQSDYWATPAELIGQGRGDCEDFSIAKYYSLIELGIPVSKLRLVYVKAVQTGPAGTFLQAHMVLAYYATPNADPLVLDNLNPSDTARLAAQRPVTDLQFQQRGPLARHRQPDQQEQSFPLAGFAGQGAR